jgi:SAM-dependent methyltransferase
MKENKYDDPDFFERYSHMPRSVNGLQAAGEWYILKELLPDLTGKAVLDLGCGYGWHCIYAKEQEAARVVGIDISAKMLAIAREKSEGLSIEYHQMAIEDIDLPAHTFDLVISSLALHYVKDLVLVCQKINTCLKPGGELIFSQEHPIFTASAQQDWYVDASGNRLHWPVDHYQEEGVRHTQFLGAAVTKYHRTLETVINTLIQSHFVIKGLYEPKPAESMLQTHPDIKDETRRPIFLLVAAQKTGEL